MSDENQRTTEQIEVIVGSVVCNGNSINAFTNGYKLYMDRSYVNNENSIYLSTNG